MKKQKYSLTARERKELRHKENSKPIEKTEPVAETEASSVVTNTDNTVAVKVKKPNVFVILLLSVLGLVLILFAILLPLVFFPQYWDAKYPIARMELSNNMVIEFEIYEDSAPIAATNFIYLARNKYFDNTIIFDNQNNYVRFGNYEDAKDYTKMRVKNTGFMDKLQGFSEKHQKNKLSYELNADHNMDGFSDVSQEGVLSFIYSRSYMSYAASEFQVCGLTGSSLIVSNQDTKELGVSMFGRCLNQESIDNIKKIAEIKSNRNNGSSFFRTLDETITIKKVTIHNLDKKKWKDLSFEQYMTDGIKDANGNTIRGISSWRN